MVAPAPAAVEPAAEPAEEEASDSDKAARPISAGLLIGAGFTFDDTLGGVNPLGFAIGLGGGYNFDAIYVGGRFVYFAGGSSAIPTGTVSMDTWLLAVEGGYDLDFGSFFVRPGLVLGITARDTNGPAPLASGFVPGASSNNRAALYLGPGAALIAPLTFLSPDLDAFFVGVDARIGLQFGGLMFEDDVSGSFELLANAGMRY